MKKILDLITDEVTLIVPSPLNEGRMMQNMQRLLYRTDLIFVNISVTAPWQPQKNTKKPHL